MGKIPLSVVVLTKNNEETNIPSCLGSRQGWAVELLVLDNESTDRTIDRTK